MKQEISMKELVGRTVTKVTKLKDYAGMDGDVLAFEFGGSAEVVYMGHFQDCCECVELIDVVGDFNDLIGSPLVISAAESNRADIHDTGSETWTYYKMDTVKGGVTLRWYGSSNGYYSEDVSLRISDIELESEDD